MSLEALKSARRQEIGEVTVIGGHLVGVSSGGGLYQFCGNRWVRLELTSHKQRTARRVIRYSGQYDARPANA